MTIRKLHHIVIGIQLFSIHSHYLALRQYTVVFILQQGNRFKDRHGGGCFERFAELSKR